LLGNPVRQYLTFEVEEGMALNISLTDIQAQRVYSWTNARSGVHSLVHSIPQGVYILSAIDQKSGLFQTEMVVFQ